MKLYEDRLAVFEKDRPGYTTEWEKLCEILTGIDGTDVVAYPDAELLLSALVAHGKLFTPATTKLSELERNACYNNSILLATELDAHVFWGYAMSPQDTKWRGHAAVWVPEVELMIETTCERTLYWGVTTASRK